MSVDDGSDADAAAPVDDAAGDGADDSSTGGDADGDSTGSGGDDTSDDADDAGGPAFDADAVGPLADRFDAVPALRPECDVEPVEYEAEIDGQTETLRSVGSATYPEPPEAFTREAVAAYVEAHERAYLRNDRVCGHSRPESLVSYTAGVRGDSLRHLDWYEDVHVVRVEFVESAYYYRADRGMSVADGFPRAAVYAVDETAVVRTTGEARRFLDEPVREATPDPVAEGQLLVTF